MRSRFNASGAATGFAPPMRNSSHGEVPVDATTDHGVAKAVYLPDPDGNELEF